MRTRVTHRLSQSTSMPAGSRRYPARLHWAALACATAFSACGDSTMLVPTVEESPPVISGVSASSVGVSEATIVWTTDRPALGTLEFGTTTQYGSAWSSGTAPGQAHQAELTDLEPGTKYHYRVKARGNGGKHAESGDQTFTTEATPDTQAPAISQIATGAVTASGASVSWSTDEPAVGLVEYGTTTAYGASTALETTPDTAHQAALAGLQPGTTYHYRVSARDGAGNQALSTNRTFTTEAAPAPPPSGSGIWVSAAEIAALPMSGSAWNNLLSEANGSCGTVDLANQDQNNNVCIMAKALVFARTGNAGYLVDVVTALTQVVNSGIYTGRALALGRELAAYVIAADLIDLESQNPTLDALFRTTIRALLTAPTTEAGSLQECHERRPNNWGTHCGGSRAAVAAYLGDTAELARVAQVFQGWLGDRSSYAGFSYGDLSWQCDSSRPVGINPAGCTRNGNSLDGVLPDDQRRGGTYTWPAPQENYVWEALQGALVQAVILDRAGYPVWDWSDRALLRAVQWLHSQNNYPASGDDSWQPHIINRYYGTNFPAPVPSQPGKNVGWTDWTHR